MKTLNRKANLSGSVLVPRALSPWDKMFLEIVESYGGFDNAHGHLDRADSVPREYLDHIYTSPLEAASLPLSAKQNMTGNLHDGKAYTEEDLRLRMTAVVERLISYGTTRFCTCIDVTPDIGENGQLAFRIAMELKQKFADRISLEIGPMPIFGFKHGTDRWKVWAEAAKIADFVALLPEKDDFTGRSDRDGKIGYREHLREGINLACALHKPVQIHVDQANDPRESGAETLIEGLKGWIEQPQIPGHNGPTIWLIHDISSACYTEERFAYHLNWLVDLCLGVICCPTAAISMRQLRAISCPTHNSVARVLELCKCGVPVLIGSDNICDIYVPLSDGDMLTEIKMLGNAIRLAIPHVLAKLAAGIPLNEVDRSTIGEVLYQDGKVCTRIDPSWKSAVDLR